MARRDNILKVIPVRIPDKIIDLVDQLVQSGFYSSRSSAIRMILTQYVLEETEKLEREYGTLVKAR